MLLNTTIDTLLASEQLDAILTPAPLEKLGGYQVARITSDSRQVTQGAIFVALVGTNTDGHDYLNQAVQQGALAVVVQADKADSLTIEPADTCVVLSANNTYETFAALSALFYKQPGQELTLAAVTGTNGKTTTTHLIERLLKRSGQATGLIGTLGSRAGASGYQSTGHTTPMADQLQATLAEMRDSQLTHVVMEVSSHALEQHRVGGCNFKVAVHTNLTQDHLDYHLTMERYFEAKALLFQGLKPGATAVINLDDDWGQRFADVVPEGVTTLTYGIQKDNVAIRATDLQYGLEGSGFTVHTPQGSQAVQLQLAGEFSVYNALAALAAGLALGLSLSDCIASLEAAEGVRGRFEVVAREPFSIVDYAHTPDGLENVLKAAKAITPDGQKLIVVFGCGGDRDASKRPQMGRLAEQLADGLVVTSDNPRTEDPQQILTDVLAGIEQFDPQRMKVVPDRREAIQQALEWAEAKDVVVVAGKGHEDYQILADRVIHFDDREEVQNHLASRQKATA